MVDVELPCCGFPAEVNHRDGDRGVVCPMCAEYFVVEATPKTIIYYDVRPMSEASKRIMKATQGGSS